MAEAPQSSGECRGHWGIGFAKAENMRLFPLPLTPFEKFMVWDECPEQPMNGFIELHFANRLNVQLLEDVFEAAVHRNPLLACKLVETEGQWDWHYDASYRPKLQQEKDSPVLENGAPVPIDLKTECGSRYWYSGREDGGSRLMIQFHHACCDGVGLRRVFLDALAGYAEVQNDASAPRESDRNLGPDYAQPKVEADFVSTRQGRRGKRKSTGHRAELDVNLLKERFDFSNTFPGPPAKPLTTWQRIKNAHYFHFQPPQALVGQPDDASCDELKSNEPLRHAVLSRDVSERVIERAKSHGVGINDVAIALLFQVCANWNASRMKVNGKSRLRLLMPYDLRSRSDVRMPATNRLSFTFLGRTHEQTEDWDTLLTSVREEVKAIKETRLQMDFLEALKLGCQSPKFLRWMLRRSHNMATAVLTYTGDMTRGVKRYFPEEDGCRMIGDARLRHVLGAPPARRNTNLALGLCINWGQLALAAAWNRSAFSASDTEQFLREYEAAWVRWAE
jgi:NRPS condensation-like uncharacterized protein